MSDQLALSIPGAGPRAADAALSSCRRYRYALWRTWDPVRPPALFVGLNPSTADETVDDPTIRRCVRFARDWGYGGLVMANLFAWRATDPCDLPDTDEAIGPENDAWLIRLRDRSGIVIAAWGANRAAARTGRVTDVLNLLGDVHALRLTAKGAPWHPLYVPAATRPTPWRSESRG